MPLLTQLIWLFVLAIPVACISWTITHEEVFREPRELCEKYSQSSKGIFRRKFFYVITCEYCFSHYVTIVMLVITKFTLLFGDWRGYLLSGFSIVWISNIYMSFFAWIRTSLKKERTIIQTEEQKLKDKEDGGVKRTPIV